MVVGAHIVDTDIYFSSADVLGMVSKGGYVIGGHIIDIKFFEVEVDFFVSNNNYVVSSYMYSYVLVHVHPYVSTGGGTLSGNLAMGGNKVTGLASPTASSDAATKAYVDAAGGGSGEDCWGVGSRVVNDTFDRWDRGWKAIVNNSEYIFANDTNIQASIKNCGSWGPFLGGYNVLLGSSMNL